MQILTVYFELLDLLPMPLEVLAFVFITAVLLYWLLKLLFPLLRLLGKVGVFLTELLTRLFLLPEYAFTNLLRLMKINYVPGSGVYDDIVRGVGGFFYQLFDKLVQVDRSRLSFPTRWIILILVLVTIAWYAVSYEELQDSVTQKYIVMLFGGYEAIKEKALSHSNKTFLETTSFQEPFKFTKATAVPTDDGICTIVWVQYKRSSLAGMYRSLVWEEIVVNQVNGSGMTEKQFNSLVVQHNPVLREDGYEFKKGKSYLLPECQ
jgi:hypothetical protein